MSCFQIYENGWQRIFCGNMPWLHITVCVLSQGEWYFTWAFCLLGWAVLYVCTYIRDQVILTSIMPLMVLCYSTIPCPIQLRWGLPPLFIMNRSTQHFTIIWFWIYFPISKEEKVNITRGMWNKSLIYLSSTHNLNKHEILIQKKLLLKNKYSQNMSNLIPFIILHFMFG